MSVTRKLETNGAMTLQSTGILSLTASTSYVLANDLHLDTALGLSYGGLGTACANTSEARTALGLAIGTNVQAYDAQLSTLAALTSVATLEDIAALAPTVTGNVIAWNNATGHYVDQAPTVADTSVTAAKLGSDVAGNGLGGGNGSALTFGTLSGVSTTNATPTVVATLSPTTGTVTMFNVYIMGAGSRLVKGDESASFYLQLVYSKSDAGVLSEVTTQIDVVKRTDATMTVSIAINTTPNPDVIEISVTGKAATNITWTARVVETASVSPAVPV